MTERFPRGVLFDLDGTLLDSAPDMVAAINLVRRDHGLEAMALETLRPHVSKGARAMVRCAFGHLDDAGREALPLMPKAEVAGRILDRLERLFSAGTAAEAD